MMYLFNKTELSSISITVSEVDVTMCVPINMLLK